MPLGRPAWPPSPSPSPAPSRSRRGGLRPCAAHPLPELFRRRRLAIPPIKEVRGQAGEWGTVGQTRTIVTSDGGTMLETLTSDRAPVRLRLHDLAGPRPDEAVGELSVDGRWSFESAGTGTLDHLDLGAHPDRASDASRCPPSARCGTATRDRHSTRSQACCSRDGRDWATPIRGVVSFPIAWGCGAAGSASRSHREGQGFESPHLHRHPNGPSRDGPFGISRVGRC